LHRAFLYVWSSLTNKCTFINLKNTLKFTLNYTQISLLHVSVFDYHQGASTKPGWLKLYL